MSLTLRQVRYFVATAEIGQISQAAIHLNISQSAVTTAIKELEGILGTLLFQRSAQGMSLTDAGRHFLNRAYVILRSVDDALNSPLPDIRASGCCAWRRATPCSATSCRTICSDWSTGIPT